MKLAALWLACTALAVALGVLAQAPSGPAGLPLGAGVTEQIPLELQLEYFRTDGIVQRLKAELEHASAEYEAAVAAVVKACGDGATPQMTSDKKRLLCVAKPKQDAH